jgi:hypothetical protein
MPNIRTGAMRQDVTGTRNVRLYQDRRDRADALDLEFELFRRHHALILAV